MVTLDAHGTLVEPEPTPLLSSCFFLRADFPCHPSPRESSLLEISHSKPSILCPSVCFACGLQSVKHYSVGLHAHRPPASCANIVSIPSTAASTFRKNKLSIPPSLYPTAQGTGIIPVTGIKTSCQGSEPKVRRVRAGQLWPGVRVQHRC